MLARKVCRPGRFYVDVLICFPITSHGCSWLILLYLDPAVELSKCCLLILHLLSIPREMTLLFIVLLKALVAGIVQHIPNVVQGLCTVSCFYPCLMQQNSRQKGALKCEMLMEHVA